MSNAYPPVFNKAMKLLVKPIEGGYTNRRSDPGNWTGGRVGSGILKGTNKGISAAAYPDEDIVNMTDERSEYLYYRDYYVKSKADKLPGPVAFMHFDAGIQHGVEDGIGNVGCEELLQRALRPAYKGVEDGIIGEGTLGALDAFHPYQLLARYSAERQKYYLSLKSMWDEYGAGWQRRLALCTLYASDIEV